MKSINFRIALVGVCFLFSSMAAHAGTISLAPSSPTVVEGNSITFDINMDFTDDATLGGGFDVRYDSAALIFDSLVFSGDLGDDPDLRVPYSEDAGEIQGISFGSFNGLRGPSTVATLTFTARNILGTTSLMLTDTQADIGGFFSFDTLDGQNVNFLGASVDVTAASAVPLPAAAWFMLSALLSLIGFRRSGTAKA